MQIFFNMRIDNLFAVLVALMVGCASVNAAPAQPAGMTMDVQGKVDQSVSGVKAPVRLLDYLQPGSTISVQDKSALSVTLYKEKKLYRFQGPAEFEVMIDGQVKLKSGNAPTTKSLGEQAVVSKQTGNYIPGSTRMRAAMAPVILLSPAKGGMLTEQPAFLWASAQPGPYTFRLIGTDGEVIWEKSVTAKEIVLPTDIKLQPDVTYKWQVSLDKGHGKSERSQFTLANSEQIQKIKAAAPAATAPIDEHVAYAIELRDAGFIQEAEKVVQVMRQTRPDIADAMLSSEQ